MTHLLDRPAWSALTGPHADLADGGALARRYRPGTVPFAAARDSSVESLAALTALPQPGEVMALVEADPPTLPPGMVGVKTGSVVQYCWRSFLKPALTSGSNPLVGGMPRRCWRWRP